MTTFDQRILTVEIVFEENSLVYAGPLYIKATGSKTIISQQNTCTIQLGNLNKSERDYLLSNCNQNLQAQYKVRRVRVMAGRQSVQSWQVFEGDIVQASISQPPDTMLTIRCTTNARDRTQWLTWSNLSNVKLGDIAQQIATLMGLTLQIDPEVNQNYIIPRFTFNGPAAALIIRLSELGGPAATDGLNGGVRVWVDDTVLHVANWKKGLTGNKVQISAQTGMVGIPEFTEYGIKVRTLADRNIVLGGAMQLTSQVVPVMNADYVISRLDYDLSTRSQEFYYDVWAYRSG
jgi:hypothetical protein